MSNTFKTIEEQISSSFISGYNGITNAKNIDVHTDGIVHPRKGWKTFAGMVYQLWLINKRYERMNIKGDFTIRLPLPKGNYRRNRK